MKRLKNSPGLFLLSVFSLLGVLIGLFLAADKIYRKHEGFYATWKELVYDEIFDSIVSANSNTIWAMDARGHLLYRAVNCTNSPECNEWLKTKEMPAAISNAGRSAMEQRTSCSFEDYRLQEEPPANIVECVRANSGRIVYYALLEDGTIWYWANNDFLPRTDRPLPTSTFLGLISGIGASILYLIVRSQKGKSTGKKRFHAG